MKNIRKYINEVVTNSGKYHDFYLLHFREMIKLIPVVGSWIDAVTIGATIDANLQERLEVLEESCKKALEASDKTTLESEIASINGAFAVIAITNLDDISKRIENALGEISNSLKLLSDNSQEVRPHKNFKFVTISGASAVGKDCLLDFILSQQPKTNAKLELLRKFTTRDKRNTDSRYYDFVTDKEFDLLDKSGNVLFPYYKRDARYGFEYAHLIDLAQQDCIVFCIFTHFDGFLTAKQVLKEKNIHHISILLTASQECLFLRSNTRNLDPNDLKKRKRSILADLVFLEENPTFVENNFDLVFENGDSSSKVDCYNKVTELIGLSEMQIQIDSLNINQN